jgi:aldose 1-epimerase
VLDNCFEHWDGTAAIIWPSRRLRLDLSATAPLEHLVVYTPPGRPHFCVEPVSHVNGQIARTRLAGGAEVSAEVAFGISTL